MRGNLRKLGKWFLKVKIICFIHFPYCISFFKNYIYNKGRMRERKKKKKGHDEGWVRGKMIIIFRKITEVNLEIDVFLCCFLVIFRGSTLSI